VSGASEPQVAWIAIEAGAVVHADDGSQIGTMREIAGDEEHDIFDGLVVTTPGSETPRYIAAERVKGIWPTRIETDLSPHEASSLPVHKATKMTRWHADSDRSFGARVKRAWNTLIGKR
jgi:hypothetical protein